MKTSSGSCGTSGWTIAFIAEGPEEKAFWHCHRSRPSWGTEGEGDSWWNIRSARIRYACSA
jgi:hypothetical protein